MNCVCCLGELSPLPYLDAFLHQPLLQCKKCSHIQLSASPSVETIRRYYGGAYAENRNAFVGPEYFEVMRKRAHAQRKLIERFVPLSGARVCDVGCGFGSFLLEVKATASQSFGLDYDDSCIAHCRKEGLDVRKIEDESQIEFEKTPVDVVIMSHVVEHLNEISETLVRIRRGAKYVFIEIPGYRADLPTQFADQEGHINFFNPESLNLLVRRLGFRVLYLREAGPNLTRYWSDRPGWRLYRRLLRKVTHDWFFNKYEKEGGSGIWIRAILQSP